MLLVSKATPYTGQRSQQESLKTDYNMNTDLGLEMNLLWLLCHYSTTASPSKLGQKQPHQCFGIFFFAIGGIFTWRSDLVLHHCTLPIVKRCFFFRFSSSFSNFDSRETGDVRASKQHQVNQGVYRYHTIQFQCLKKKKKRNSSPKVGCSFVVHKTFIELHRKTFTIKALHPVCLA